MSAIKKVVLAGASGNLGPAILKALLGAGTFDVTVLTRESSTATFPSDVKVTKVDYTSLESLTNALRGQDAVVSTLGMLAMSTQTLIIDAAIAAGVRRFLPSEFGSDTQNPRTGQLPVFKSKIAVQKYLEKKSKETQLTYTPIITSAFLDWGLGMGFFFNFKERKATLYDGGDRPFSATRLSGIGAAVVGVLQHPEETKNRVVYVHEAVVTQNQFIKIAQEVAPDHKWETEEASTEKLEKEALENLAGPADKRNPYAMYHLIYRAIFGEGYGGEMTKTDNELLGVPMMSDEQVRELVETYVEK